MLTGFLVGVAMVLLCATTAGATVGLLFFFEWCDNHNPSPWKIGAIAAGAVVTICTVIGAIFG